MSRESQRIPVEPLQHAVAASGLSLSEICYRIGWLKRSGHRTLGDTSRLQRALGLRIESHGRHSYPNRRVSIGTATRIARALDLDPHIIDSWIPEPQPEPEAAVAADGRCPECGTTATWTDSWDQQRCDQCWTIVAGAGATEDTAA